MEKPDTTDWTDSDPRWKALAQGLESESAVLRKNQERETLKQEIRAEIESELRAKALPAQPKFDYPSMKGV